MSKHKSKKKRNLASKGSRKAAASTAVAADASVESAPAAKPTSPSQSNITTPAKTTNRPVIDQSRWGYVGRDVRRIVLLAGACIALLVVIWYLFGHSGLGDSVYSLFKV